MTEYTVASITHISLQLQANVEAAQRAMMERLMPAMREASFQMGRLSLTFYLSLPRHRRLWADLRSGRFVRNLREAVASFR